jgi:energy-coupling factor transporter ATP-binding protein EcfA2
MGSNDEKKSRLQPPPTYFLSLVIENIRCFGPRQSLDFSDGNDFPAQWTVILGDNGTGKTTLLQCLAVLEFGDLPEYGWLTSATKGKKAFQFSGTILSGVKLADSGKEKTAKNFAVRGISNKRGYKRKEIRGAEAGGLVCYGYGSARRMGGVAVLTDRTYTRRSLTLFNDDAVLFNAEEWLLKLDYIASKTSQVQEKFKKRLDQVKHILIHLVPDIKEIHLTTPTEKQPNPKIVFRTDYGWVSIDDLSLGHKTMIAWGADLIRRLFERYPDSENPIAEPAVVLMDEIGLHLHPRWQREVMQFLSREFVNTQFIVTTHSPLVAQSTYSIAQQGKKVNLIVLKKMGNHVLIKKEEPPRGWRIDQVAACDLFGLTTYPAELEVLIQERRNLLFKSKLTKQDERRLKELESLIGQLPADECTRDIEAMEIIRTVAQELREFDEDQTS